MTTVLMFPGQSSRYPGMLEKLVALHTPNQVLAQRASDQLGRDLLAHYRADNADAFATNQDVQVGVFLANQMFLQILEDKGVRADLSLGLSLGEWNHLVHIGALPFEEALRGVEARGAAYDAGPRGMMVSVFPLEQEPLEELVQRARSHGVLEIVNLNSPRQHVLAGEVAAVEHAIALLEDEFMVSTVIIERQVPMHSSLFESVGSRFAETLATLPFQQPKLPYFPNRLAEPIAEPTAEQFRELLATHVHRPVLWRRSIDLVMERYADPVLIEVGPKRVLYNLVDRKWYRRPTKYHLDETDNAAQQIESVLEALSALDSSSGNA